MKVVNLFAGRQTWLRPWRDRGHDTFATDIRDLPGLDLVEDVFKLDPQALPYRFQHPDVLLASPPCEGFSVAAIGHNWHKDDGVFYPKSEQAYQSLALIERLRELVLQLMPSYVVIENPRGVLRKTGQLDNYERVTVTYCQYGEKRMKPTDLWGGFPTLWKPRPPCKNGDPCHERAPRGSHKGTQGLKLDDRAAIPYLLSEELMAAAERSLY